MMDLGVGLGFNAFLERLDRVYYGNLIGSGVELYKM